MFSFRCSRKVKIIWIKNHDIIVWIGIIHIKKHSLYDTLTVKSNLYSFRTQHQRVDVASHTENSISYSLKLRYTMTSQELPYMHINIVTGLTFFYISQLCKVYIFMALCICTYSELIILIVVLYDVWVHISGKYSLFVRIIGTVNLRYTFQEHLLNYSFCCGHYLYLRFFCRFSRLFVSTSSVINFEWSRSVVDNPFQHFRWLRVM